MCLFDADSEKGRFDGTNKWYKYERSALFMVDDCENHYCCEINGNLVLIVASVGLKWCEGFSTLATCYSIAGRFIKAGSKHIHTVRMCDLDANNSLLKDLILRRSKSLAAIIASPTEYKNAMKNNFEATSVSRMISQE